jgi:carnosine N-methyltransferase
VCRSTSAHQFQIFPNLHSFSNHLTTEQNLLRSYTLPDILPSSLLPADSQFSFVAGDFEEVYGGKQENGAWGPIPEDQAGQWGAVVTCFFLDTARNVINYLKIIKGLLREDGIWVNVGPLLWHWENVQDRERGEGSIELSLDEVKELAREMGFIISVRLARVRVGSGRELIIKFGLVFSLQNEKMDTAAYTGDPDTMLRSEYQVSRRVLSISAGGVAETRRRFPLFFFL